MIYDILSVSPNDLSIVGWYKAGFNSWDQHCHSLVKTRIAKRYDLKDSKMDSVPGIMLNEILLRPRSQTSSHRRLRGKVLNIT